MTSSHTQETRTTTDKTRSDEAKRQPGVYLRMDLILYRVKAVHTDTTKLVVENVFNPDVETVLTKEEIDVCVYVRGPHRTDEIKPLMDERLMTKIPSPPKTSTPTKGAKNA